MGICQSTGDGLVETRLHLEKPSSVRTPVQNGRSAGSMSLVSRFAELASVRATTRIGTPLTSAASRAAISALTCCAVGTRTLPPMCPHFFRGELVLEVHARRPGLDERLGQLKTLSARRTPASPSATIGTIQSMVWSPSAQWT